MGLMDTVKQQAEQALAKAQQGVSQGQAKLDQVQGKRQADSLLRDLGAAYYAWQRTGASQGDVEAALELVDQHVATHGPVDTTAGTVTAGDTPAGPAAGTAAGPNGDATGGQGGHEAGNFSIDDM